MRRNALSALAVAAACLAGTPAGAQWIQQPTAGIPRTADGKPDLSAPAPRTAAGTPDLTGMWRIEARLGVDVNKLIRAAGPKPWARERQARFEYELGRDSPFVHCLPAGPLAVQSYGFAGKFVHTPGLLVMLFDDLTFRQIHLDGRQLEADPNPSWMGYSVGRWDGDALVVTSNGFNDRSILDGQGFPHTETLRITERFRRRDFGHMDVEVTLEDPGTLDAPVTLPLEATYVADTELIEYVCQENEKSRQRMIGTADDDKKLAVPVATSVLAAYAGTYRVDLPEGNPPVNVRVYVLDGTLALDIERGPSDMKMVPISQTKFLAQGVAVEFFPKPDGAVRDLVITIVEGDLKGVRVD